MRLGLLVLLAFASLPRFASAAEIPIDPAMSQSAIDAAVQSLLAGDVLLVAPGVYADRELDLRDASSNGLVGTEALPITIRGVRSATGERPHIVADTDAFQEAIRIRPGSRHLRIEGLHLSAVGSDVQAGIYVDDDVAFVTIDDVEIDDVTGIGIQIQLRNDVHDVTVEDTEIHHTGTNTSSGSNGGQAFTAGGFSPDQATSGVHHLVLRHLLVHDTRGQEGDCAKFMYGVYASVIEDSVFYDCPRGVAQQENYGITSYGAGPSHYAVAADANVLRRNLLFRTRGTNAGERNVAIYAGPGTVVENNLVVDADIGIAARLEGEVPVMRNLRVVHNTVYRTTDHAFSIRGTADADGSVVVANNVFAAVVGGAFGYRAPDPLGNAAVTRNYFEGLDYAEVDAAAMIAIATPLDTVFESPGPIAQGVDFFPREGSVLVDAAEASFASALDYDLAARPVGAAADVGAYERRSPAPDHLPIGPAFKGPTDAPIDYGALGDGGCGCALAGRPVDPTRGLACALVLAVLVGRRASRRARTTP